VTARVAPGDQRAARLLAYLANRAAGGLGMPSRPQINSATGLPVGSIGYLLKLLEQSGALQRTGSEAGGGYVLVLDSGAAVALAARKGFRTPLPADDSTVRQCLKCEGDFLSSGIGNRLCERCRDENAGCDSFASGGGYALHLPGRGSPAGRARAMGK
jgi:hypothetical protein